MNGFSLHCCAKTIHSWAGIGLGNGDNYVIANRVASSKYKKANWKKVQLLIIDEVSMMSVKLLELLNLTAKKCRNTQQIFGGIQIICSGDLFQLPPIAKNGKNADFVHKSEIWQDMNIKMCYLQEQYRQNDKVFSQVLNDIRSNDITTETVKILKNRIRRRIKSKVKATKLYTHNVDVDRINQEALDKIKRKKHHFYMVATGNSLFLDSLKRTCGTSETLELKVGSAVMFVKNNLEEGYVNGTLGKVVDFSDYGFPIVQTVDEREITAFPVSWSMEEEGKKEAEISQVPLRLAWAITVHKSQGMSLDLAEIDLSKSFVQGMGYVALSRVRSLQGIRLLGINRMALTVNPEVVKLDKIFRELSVLVVDDLDKLGILKKNKKQRRFLESNMDMVEETLF
jgi:ATP-dependent exoDNAse (exonuclease V) alpha subunit